MRPSLLARRPSARAARGARCARLRAAAPRSQPRSRQVASEGLETLEARLDRAVDRVSLPHAARLLGRGGVGRGYRLPGYGMVLVLTPARAAGRSRAASISCERRGAKGARGCRVETSAEGRPARPWSWTSTTDEGVETFERQVLVLQHEAEAARPRRRGGDGPHGAGHAGAHRAARLRRPPCRQPADARRRRGAPGRRRRAPRGSRAAGAARSGRVADRPAAVEVLVRGRRTPARRARPRR